MTRSKGKRGALALMKEPAPQSEAGAQSSKPRAARAKLRSVAPPPADAAAAEPPLEAVVDGKRVVIDAQDEVVIRCGKASITLRRNGRVIIRGTYVETRSEGVNRIRGGSVQIN
jgi:hypothetical protein